MNSNLTPAGQPELPPVMNVSKSLERMGGDRGILHDLASFFLEDSVELMSTLKSSLDAKDSKQAARSAHSLSGLAANFTANTCMALGKTIEDLCLKNDFNGARILMPQFESEIDRLVAAIKSEILV